MRVYRMEFWHPDGHWSGPYQAEWLTPEAADLRAEMLAAHRKENDRAWPNSRLFANSGGYIHYLAGTESLSSLGEWFGDYLGPLIEAGGHTAVYQVPRRAVAYVRDGQVVFNSYLAVLLDRVGKPVQEGGIVERIHPSQFAPLEGDSDS